MTWQQSVRESVNDTEGLLGLRFYTIGVSDGISMGTDGMRYSLVSRDVIADSIETNAGAQYYDALIAFPVVIKICRALSWRWED